MFKKLLSLFLKSNCPLCKRPANNILCEYCTEKINTYQLHDCKKFWQGDLPVFVWGKYDGELKRSIFSFKYDLHQEIGEFWGNLLAKEWLNYGFKNKYKKITIVPIPLHKKKQKERGFNQAELIAKRFAQINRYNFKPHLIARIKDTKAMFNLTVAEREKNLEQAFSLGKDYQKFNHNSSVILVDDIYTSGATVKAVSQVLAQNNIKVLGVVAIASPKS